MIVVAFDCHSARLTKWLNTSLLITYIVLGVCCEDQLLQITKCCIIEKCIKAWYIAAKYLERVFLSVANVLLAMRKLKC